MNDQEFVFTYRTRFGTFRIQPHHDKFGLFIDYPQGEWDLLTPCVSPHDGADYVFHQDTGIAGWDSMPSERVPLKICDIVNWQRKPFHRQSA